MSRQIQKLEHAPTLNTIIMVENTLKNMNESAVKISKLKTRLPKQVNHNTLMIILDYLEKSNKIAAIIIRDFFIFLWFTK